jgi:hypothetical protein
MYNHIDKHHAISMRVANRQASKQRLQAFEALAAFANMGDTPEDWRKFRLLWPDFFPTTQSQFERPGFRNLTEWLYSFSERWVAESADPNTEDSGDPVGKEMNYLNMFQVPLLWYRDRLRAVWAANDPTGANLCVLYGLEKQAHNIGIGQPFVVRTVLIPGESLDPSKHETVGGLPQGTPVVNGVTGEITWKFGCDLQQSVYDLMQCRWRAKICPECGRYYVADKTAQTLCSTRCFQEAKRKRALAYWNREGRARRAEQKKHRAQRRKT